jgi:5-methylcytosine-specific restriction endonuclease McrA
MRNFSHKGNCEGKKENCRHPKCGEFGNLYLSKGQVDNNARLKYCLDKPVCLPENQLQRTKINKASKKTKNNAEKRAEVRRIVMQRDMGLCQAKFLVNSITCSGTLDIDEVIPRGRGGNYLDPTNCQVLCRAHHRWKHDNPAEAERLGLTKSLPPSG